MDEGKGPLGPRYCSKLTNKLIYDHLPPGVASALRETCNTFRREGFADFVGQDEGRLV